MTPLGHRYISPLTLTQTLTLSLTLTLYANVILSEEGGPSLNVSSKAAAEELGYTFLPCVLAYLHRFTHPLKHINKHSVKDKKKKKKTPLKLTPSLCYIPQSTITGAPKTRARASASTRARVRASTRTRTRAGASTRARARSVWVVDG